MEKMQIMTIDSREAILILEKNILNKQKVIRNKVHYIVIKISI